ncbi:MAG TPA: efflux transporter outer membrane subunit [Nitrospirales bacterium]|nr:efflux transporter outer membrane subunit [Nitrospirales bacterium]
MKRFRLATSQLRYGSCFHGQGTFRWERLIGACMLVFGLQGCLVGPDFQKPDTVIPPSWDVMTEHGDASRLPVSMDEVPEVSWWRSFQNEELNGLIEQALERNHDMRQAGFRVLEARALAKGAGAGLYPNVSVDGAYTRIRRSESILVAPTSGAPQGFAPPGANFDIWNSAIDLRWELDLWGRIRRSQEAFSAEAFASEMDRRGIVLSLISDVGQAYFRLRELDEQLEIAEHNLLLQQDSLSLIRNRAHAGLISDLDVKRAEILVAQTAAQIPELRRQRGVQRHQLELLTGASPNTLTLAPKPLRTAVVQPIIPIGLPADLLQRRPDIVEVEETLIAANARIGEARAYFFPTVALTGTGGFQTSEFDQWFKWGSRNLSIGPSVTLPIFEGYTNIARLEVAELRYQQLLEQYQQTILNAFREVADVLVALQTREEQITQQRRQVQSAQDARELADIRYRKGLVTYLDVLDAQRTVLEAELALVQTERARLTDMVSLFKAVGGGWQNEQFAQAHRRSEPIQARRIRLESSE